MSSFGDRRGEGPAVTPMWRLKNVLERTVENYIHVYYVSSIDGTQGLG